MPQTPPAADRARVPEPGPLRPFHFPRIERFSLSNGIPVLFASSGRLPVITMSVLLRAGGVHERAERAGLATLTGSLLESGAGHRGAAEIAEALETLGVSVDVGTSWDASHVDLTALRDRVPAASGILAELVRQPTFPPDEVDRLRQEQLAGILQRRAEPRGLANEMASRFIFAPTSPFARPLGGTGESVERLGRAEVAAFHAANFSPNGAALVIVGDLSLDEAADLAERGFGDWSGAAAHQPDAPATPLLESTEIVVVDRPGSVQSELRVGHVGVHRNTPDYFPLVVMNTILGGAFSSRLNLNLREKHGFTYGVSSSFVMRRQPGPFLVSTAVQTEVTAAALTEILKELAAIRAEPVAARELQDARNYLAGIFPLRLQTTDGLASRLAELVLYDLPTDYFDGYRERILAVTDGDVLRVARRHVQPDRLAVVVVGDAASIRGPLEELGVAPVRVVDAGGEEAR